MKNSVYVLVTGEVILLVTTLMTQKISIAMMLAILFLMAVQFICLTMVNYKSPQVNHDIQWFLTLFTWFLYIPIFLTTAENLIQPTLGYFIRFCAIIEISYVLIAISVIFSVKYQYEKNDSVMKNKEEASNQ
ncbi:hypothetical protein [Rummeliibacillus pycnus]|uniref:hypothetical protein n=1 Tax=Rummeliibacillus pycnus TaxID=101070 RepID=UPI000C9AB522|nr:hypothetical protein [Rummeliibacillus pycnus]